MDLADSRPLAGAVVIEPTEDGAGRQAAAAAADLIVAAQQRQGSARVIFASAPSQQAMLAHLRTDERIDWAAVRSFHMDDYLGLAPDHPQAFGQWLSDRLPEAGRAGLERIDATADPEAEVARYSALLAAAPIDVTCLGIGVNGHIAFNEPGDTDFEDERLVRRIRLDDVSRKQQVDDDLFETFDDVPEYALTLTVPALTGAAAMVATVIGPQKADAVRAALQGPLTTDCPASVLRNHPLASLYLDAGAASKLGQPS
ncbi:6-phosphogluconolactonase [Microlunatus speluncae]|uniref:6-phosphogluconolactonase n=1 Tax=Microlunatus speluncae TaxID=2594267 RepID=UPI0012667306|nr:6-phosphogluconolactonase [Microlunatus speluncae]